MTESPTILRPLSDARLAGLAFIAAKASQKNLSEYITGIAEGMGDDGARAQSQALYAAGNSRFQQLHSVHPRTLSAIRKLLQLDGFTPDGMGNQPDAFDASIADANIDNLGTLFPRP